MKKLTILTILSLFAFQAPLQAQTLEDKLDSFVKENSVEGHYFAGLNHVKATTQEGTTETFNVRVILHGYSSYDQNEQLPFLIEDSVQYVIGNNPQWQFDKAPYKLENDIKYDLNKQLHKVAELQAVDVKIYKPHTKRTKHN